MIPSAPQVAMDLAKDCSLKRPFEDTQPQSAYPVFPGDPRCMDLSQPWTQVSWSLAYSLLQTDASSNPVNKKARRPSLVDFPNEIILNIQSYLHHPLDLLRFSQTCRLFRASTNERAWCRLYTILVPHWSAGTEVSHLQRDTDSWKQVVIDDFLRRDRWSVPAAPSVEGDLTDMAVPPRLRINLDHAIRIKPPHMYLCTPGPSSKSSRWRNVGSPVSNIDLGTQASISAYMQACTFSDHTDHRISIYGLPDHERPLAIIPSYFWAHHDVDRQLYPVFDDGSLGVAQLTDIKQFPAQRADRQLYPAFDEGSLGVAQLIDIKQFPAQRDEQGRMRVVIVIAFGEQSRTPFNALDGEVQYLDVWLLIKAIEIYICDTPVVSTSDNSIQPRLVPYRPDPFQGRVETIVPSTREEHVRGRAVKLYLAEGSLKIALFGIHQGTRTQAVVMTSSLFGPSQPVHTQSMCLDSIPSSPSWQCRALGGITETSCMALFPPQSDFDHLIVLLDRNGRGEIWNWKTVALVAILTEKSESGQDLERKRHEYRKDLYYWGVQINWSVEEPVISSRDSVSAFGTGAAHRKQGDFSVVALADGEGKEWETCWWNVSDKMLRMSKEAMPPQPTEIGWSSRYFQELTLGRTSPPSASQETRRHADKPLSFIAYLTWNHYRITLTSQHGLCIFDMDREVQDETMSGGSEISDTGTTMELEERQQKQIPQWVTMIDDAEDDPLVDIATMGDCLMLTRKYSHMIFPFRSSHARQP